MKFYRKPTGLVMLVIHDPQFEKGRFYFSTGETVSKDEWDAERGFTKKSGTALNVRLADLLKKANDYILTNRNDLTAEKLKRALKSTAPKEVLVTKRKTLIEEYEDYLSALKGDVSHSTYISYRRAYRVFRDFLELKGKMYISPEHFGFREYQSFQVYLKQEVKHTTRVKKKATAPVGYDTNTVGNITKRFKMFVNYLQKIRVNLDMSPDEIKFEENAGLKISISEQELDAIEQLPLVGGLARGRDLMLVQCGTGVRISDFLGRLDSNIVNGSVQMETQKVVGNYIKVPIVGRVKRILEKYNYVLPYMSEVTYRGYIKDVYKLVNPTGTIQVRRRGKFETRYIWQEISSHDMVRTFITLSAEKGMSIPSIAKIVGKTVKVLLNNYLVESEKTAQESMIAAWAK
jgi:hypothetical protein